MANKRLNAIITIGGAVSGSLMGALGSTQKKLKGLGDEIRQLEKQRKSLGAALNDPSEKGYGVNHLKKRYDALGDSIDKARKKQEKLIQAQRGMADGKGMMASGAKGVGIVGAVASAGLFPVVKAAQFETAMLGVAKQVEGARDESGNLTAVYHDMAKQVQLLGREMHIPTNQIAEMAASGARMGVAKDELIGFTQTAGMMSTAFELPAGELADNMGKIAGLYKIPIPAIGELADTINYLDDNAISKGGDIIEFLTRTGGAAASVRITGKEMAALGSTLLTLGETTETAGTAANAIFAKFGAAEKGTKKFQGAMAELGLSSTAVQMGMQQDAQATVLTVLDAINKLPENQRIGVMTDLVGMEHADTLGKLAGNTGEYRSQIGMAESENAVGSVQKEYDATRKTSAARWQIFNNLVDEFSVNVGNQLLPVVNSAMIAIGDVVAKVTDWTKENPGWTKSILAVAGGILGAVGAMNTLKMAVGGVKFAFNALKLVTATNPLGLAFVILTTAAVLIYTHWEPISAFFKGIWEGIKEYAEVAWTWIKDTVLNYTPLGLVVQHWDPIKNFFKDTFETIKTTIGSAIDWALGKIAMVGDAWNATKSFFGFGDGGAKPALAVAGGGGGRPLPNPAVRTGGQNVTQTHHNSWVVQVPPGTDGKQFARDAAGQWGQALGAQQKRGKPLYDRAGRG